MTAFCFKENLMEDYLARGVLTVANGKTKL